MDFFTLSAAATPGTLLLTRAAYMSRQAGKFLLTMYVSGGVVGTVTLTV